MVSAISLPSIHEGFPHIDFGEPAVPGSYGPALPAQMPPPLELVSRTRAPSRSKPSTNPYPSSSERRWDTESSNAATRVITLTPVYVNVTSRARTPAQSPPRYYAQPAHQSPPLHGQHVYSHAGPSSPRFQEDPRGAPQAHPQPRPQSASRTASSATSTAKSSPAPQTHSFDVLRSEPGTFSLEHITSSKTLQHRSASSSPPVPVPASKHTAPSPASGVANGSVPAFRVSMVGATAAQDKHLKSAQMPAAPVSSSAKRGSGDASPQERHVVSFTADAQSPPSHTGVAKLALDGNGHAYFQDVAAIHGGDDALAGNGGIFRVDGRGKKHQCPQCPKRFNRPSSLRIHVNTHTGARPFQCPHPKCGREFNVNSNMRRHYRNHGMPAAAPVHPPRHNSGRRPDGYARTHPGRTPRSEGTGSGDVSDADFDMEDGSASEGEDGEDSDATVASLDVYAPAYTRQPLPAHGWPQAQAQAQSQSQSPSPPPYARYPSSADRYAPPYESAKVSTTLRPAFR